MTSTFDYRFCWYQNIVDLLSSDLVTTSNYNMKALLLLTVLYIHIYICMYIGKDPDAESGWGQKQKDMAEDEMIR